MKDLIKQILKFGVVGGICFIIDYLIGIVFMNIFMKIGFNFETASAIAAVFGFGISAVINYILSFKFVFERKEDLNRKVEFIAFIALSIIGLGLNTFLMWVSTGPIYQSSQWMQDNLGYNMMYTLARAIAAGIVMVYNFVTRKVFLENKKSVKAD